MNNSLLYRALTKRSSYVQESKSTDSTYFHIDNIVARVSDHTSERDSYDLAIIRSVQGYVLIPKIGQFKQIQVVRNVPSVIKYIDHFSYFKNIFLGKPIQPSEEDLIVDFSGNKGKFFEDGQVKNWICNNSQPENLPMLSKLYDYYAKTDSVQSFIATLKMYQGLNAERKHDYLSKMCQRLSI